MTETELKIIKLEDAIRVLNWHLFAEQHPTKYSLPKSAEKRQLDIEFIQNRKREKQNEIEQLKTLKQ